MGLKKNIGLKNYVQSWHKSMKTKNNIDYFYNSTNCTQTMGMANFSPRLPTLIF